MASADDGGVCSEPVVLKTKRAYNMHHLRGGGVQGLFAGEIFVGRGGGEVATLGNPKAPTASYAPERASPCAVQSQKYLQIKLLLNAALVHDI